MKPLTVEILKRLSFTRSIHLNRGNEHDTTSWNEEYKLLHSSTAKRSLGWKIVANTLTSQICPDASANLMVGSSEYDAELQKFCDAYNAALAQAPPL